MSDIPKPSEADFSDEAARVISNWDSRPIGFIPTESQLLAVRLARRAVAAEAENAALKARVAKVMRDGNNEVAKLEARAAALEAAGQRLLKAADNSNTDSSSCDAMRAVLGARA